MLLAYAVGHPECTLHLWLYISRCNLSGRETECIKKCLSILDSVKKPHSSARVQIWGPKISCKDAPVGRQSSKQR